MPRVRRGHDLAAINASVVSPRVGAMSGKEPTGAERAALLHDVAGSCLDSGAYEPALPRSYGDGEGNDDSVGP